ncbi:MAG: TonB-dependent receptor [Runella slithyformis]|nr:MAG: TonB-dependent receptor [Runella slithyformis]TAF29818.1 MAG: TonB-dependent receptor [Runella slithyformis]TAF48831.1 MAG: TonB-dependent receptor [Runella slithyformis]TAF83414.1 MAG: TonB-dependent receptor [Runella slithyformis]
MKHFFFWAVVLLCASQGIAQKRYTVSGFVRETGSQELLIGVNVYVPNTTIGTSTNTYGFYSITLPATDSVTLAFSFVGYGTESQKLTLNKNQEFNVSLVPGRVLEEVVVSERRTSDRVSDNVQMSQIEIPISQIKKIPAFLGEKDVMRVLQLMPGVQKGSEGQTGIYVRGGGPDQNLIILDDAVVYNASHLFGFFSVFNGDALKSVELTKGGFPARFGGRLSSVVELNMKEGNKEKLHGEGGGGIIASRLTLEGPLIKNKASFLVSGRRTYLDLLARPIIAAQSDGGTGGYYFYDLNAKVNYDFGRKDKLYLSGYFGQDRFFFRDKSANSTNEGGLNWGNATGTLRWNHLFNEKLFSNASLIFSNYKFQIYAKDAFTSNNRQSEFELRYTSGVRDLGFKYDFDFFPNPEHALRFGFSSTFHRFTPSAIVVRDTDINEFKQEIEAINNVESGLYVEDTWKPNKWLKMNAGLRLSHFTAENTTYLRPEPRLSVAATLRPDLSVKGSYAIMNQYIHLLSNTGIGLPTDLWVPSTAKISPQQSSQVALGIAKDFDKRGLALTVEGYYKTMNNIVNYKEGASFLLIEGPEGADKIRWDDNVTSGRGWSYGAEVLLQKKTGRLSGWVGYTLSWTQWQFPELNFGQTFFPRYDRRHDISVVAIYELSKRITLSGTWVYGTGNALTLPQSSYTGLENAALPQINFNQPNPALSASAFGFGRTVNDYGPKNSFRAEPYHRFDLSLQFHKKKRRHERTWELSVYNLYNRRNPFFYNFTTRETFDANGRPNGNETVLRRISIFPIVPTLSYNFSF